MTCGTDMLASRKKKAQGNPSSSASSIETWPDFIEADVSNVRVLVVVVFAEASAHALPFQEPSIMRMCESAQVIINCVGPFKLYGDVVVRSCVAAGTDYVDITGEPQVSALGVRGHVRPDAWGAHAHSSSTSATCNTTRQPKPRTSSSCLRVALTVFLRILAWSLRRSSLKRPWCLRPSKSF